MIQLKINAFHLHIQDNNRVIDSNFSRKKLDDTISKKRVAWDEHFEHFMSRIYFRLQPTDSGIDRTHEKLGLRNVMKG